MDNPDPTQFITILAHKAALVDQQSAFDEMVKANTEAISTHAAAIATKDEEIQQITAARDAARAAFEEKSAYQTAMEQRVSAVIQSGDPAQYEALARDFLTPAQEKERAEKMAQLAALKAELGIE